MASSLYARVVNRATQKDADIRAALKEADGPAALWAAYQALTSEGRKVLRRRPADAGLIYAELAARTFAISTGLHARKPVPVPGCPKVPQPEHLIAAYEAELQRAAEEAERNA